MKLVAGIDIGNSTTEVALARITSDGKKEFLGSGMVRTTGVKGTVANIRGAVLALEDAASNAGVRLSALNQAYLNEATPVIADVAMETITETIITESSMIGHDPATPGGRGLGVGTTVDYRELSECSPGQKVVPVFDRTADFAAAAVSINEAMSRGVLVEAAIMQKDDAVLLVNRLNRVIPVVDEVSRVEKVPLGMLAAVEVAETGRSIQTLSNPYGLATIFDLTPEETKNVVPIARALTGNRSGVVIRTPSGDVRERVIPAGSLTFVGKTGRLQVSVDAGAAAIMAAAEKAFPLQNVEGEAGSNVGGMINRIRTIMGELTGEEPQSVSIQDLLAVDTMVQTSVAGGLAGELSSECAVAIGAMVKTSRLPMEQIARGLARELGVTVEIAGVEAEMAVLGALTTPGVEKPLAVLDIGGGSTDAALIRKDGTVSSIHLAGAGDMVTMLIDSELSLNNRELAEEIKRYPLAKVESLFHIRLEDGTVQFFDHALDPGLFARVSILKDGGVMVPLPTRHSLEKVRMVRRQCKEKVFVTNALRALSKITSTGNIRSIDFVVLVGGSALDFEIPAMITGELARHGVVAGRANIRGLEGPRSAVATGLVLAAKT